jgi:beta-lactam-binding protein with PASTA domain
VSTQTPVANTSVPLTTQVGFTICSPLDKVSVPTGLVGGTQAAAEAALKDRGLDVDIRPVDSASPKGQVIEVEDEGKEVEPGTNITVKVSNNQLVVVPDVIGKTQDGAEALLQNAGLNVNPPVFVTGGGEPGTVIKQSKKAKSKVESGTSITITIVSNDPTADPSDSVSPTPTDTTGTGGGDGTE